MLQELQGGREALLSKSNPLRVALRALLGSGTTNFYVIDSIPEQAEDLYDVLVDGETIVHLELVRATGTYIEGTFKKWTVAEYVREQSRMTKPKRRRINLAIDLAKTDHL